MAIGSMKRCLALMALAAVAGFSARAETAYFNSGSDGYLASSWHDASKWQLNGVTLGGADEDLPSEYDYAVANGNTLRAPSVTADTFPGLSLMLGEGNRVGTLVLQPTDNRVISVYTIRKFYLNNGRIQNNTGRSPEIAADIVVGNTVTEEKPFVIYDYAAQSETTFSGKLTGGDTAAFWIYCCEYADQYKSGVPTERTSGAYFKGDILKGYSGHLICHPFQKKDAAGELTNPALCTVLRTDAVISDAKVTITPQCKLAAGSTGTISFKSIDLQDNAVLEVYCDKTTGAVSTFVAQELLTLGSGIKIAFDPKLTFASGGLPEQVLTTPMAILKAPLGMTLDPADFDFVSPVFFPEFKLYEATDPEDGRSTLFIKQLPIVQHTVNDDYSSTQAKVTVFAYGDHWENGVHEEGPDQDHAYYSAYHTLRALSPEGDGYKPYVKFPGYQLTIGPGTTMALFCEQTEIDRLQVAGNGSTYIYSYTASYICDLSGKIDAAYHANDNAYLYLRAYQNREMSVSADISGKRRIMIQHGGKTDEIGKYTKYRVGLLGDNRGYTGRINFGYANSSTMTPLIEDNDETLELYFNNGWALGGDTPDWTYDAVRLNNYARLRPTESLTLSAKNRGIFVDGYGRIVCDEAVDFTLMERLTYNGELLKRGAGTLSLGGEAPFFTTDGGTTPTANKNLLVIEEGALKPVSSEAFRGVDLRFAADTVLELDSPADPTAGVGKLGMDFTKAGSSLTIADTKLKTVLYPVPGTSRYRTTPICTVNTADLGMIDGKFELPDVPDRYQSSFDYVDNGNGTKTLVVKLAQGTVIFVK